MRPLQHRDRSDLLALVVLVLLFVALWFALMALGTNQPLPFID